MDREIFDEVMARPSIAARLGYLTGYFLVQIIDLALRGLAWGGGLILAIVVLAHFAKDHLK